MNKQQINKNSNQAPGWPVLIASTAVGGAAVGGGYLLGKPLLADPAIEAWLQWVKAGIGGWDLLAVPLLLLVVLGAHEVGHLLGGMSQRMRFLLLIFGPFQWSASSSGVKFRWVTHLGLMGGIAAVMPTEVGSGLRRQLLATIAGGPAASLVLATVALPFVTASDPRIAAYGALVALCSLGIFLVTALPLRSGGFMSDGMQLVEILRGSQSVVERAKLLHLSAQSLSGVRPRDWDPRVVAELIDMKSSEPLRQIAAWQMLLYRSMDTGNHEDICKYRHLLSQDVGRFADGFRQAIHVELAICAALDGNAQIAERHLSSSKGGVVEPSRRLLALASVARLQDRGEESRRYAERALKALPGALDPGLAALTREQLEAEGWSG